MGAYHIMCSMIRQSQILFSLSLSLTHEHLRINIIHRFETSWKLEVRNPDKNNRYEQIESGPPLPTKYADNTRYIGVYCLSNGQYKFIINGKVYYILFVHLIYGTA